MKTSLWSGRALDDGEPYFLGIDSPDEYKDFSDWVCVILGPTVKFTVRPRSGEVPNRFHRWMQSVLLGFKWERLK